MAKVDMEMINQMKPNSYKYKEEQAALERAEERKKLDSVVKKGNVVSTKKPLKQKFAELFIKEDVADVKSYLIMDVIIPGMKNLLLDGLSMILTGEVRERRRGSSYYDRDYGRTNYSGYYRNKERSSRSRERDRRDYYEEDDKIDYRNIILLRREEAEDVIDQMHKRIKEQGSASVADLFDLIDVAGRYTDNDWGWTSIRQIGLKRVHGGWLIDVDRAEYLN